MIKIKVVAQQKLVVIIHSLKHRHKNLRIVFYEVNRAILQFSLDFFNKNIRELLI